MKVLERFDRDGDQLTVRRHDTSTATFTVEGRFADRTQTVVLDVEDLVDLAYELLSVSGCDSDEVTAAIELLRPVNPTTQSDEIEVWSA